MSRRHKNRQVSWSTAGKPQAGDGHCVLSVPASSHHRFAKEPLQTPANSWLFAAAPKGGDDGSKPLRNLPVSRDSPIDLQSFCSTLGEREADLVAHPALGWMTVEALDEGAAVGMAELVGNDVWRQSP